MVFRENNHRPGAAGLGGNGIYFGTTLTDGGVQTTNFEVSAGAEAFVNMYDPMASQGDNLTNSNGDIYNRLVVNVDKTGAGTWLLGGHNKMQSESHWNIREGELHLVGGVSLLSRSADNPAVTIELSHPDSSFTLHPGARLMAAIGGESHLISANEIHLLAGSTAGVIGLYNQPFVVPNALPDAPLEVLTLSHGSLLRHEQEIEQQSGVMEVGLSNYNYRLYWGGPDNTILYLDYISLAGPDEGQTSLRSRAAIEALSAPGAMALASMTGDRLTDRTRGLFWTENFRPEKNGFWVAPYLGRRNKSGQPGAYDIDTYGGMIGYDYQLGGYSASPAFLGLAFDWTRSDYDSRDADLKGKKDEGLVYGGLTLPGEVELTGYAGVGRTNYDQQRKVGDFNYSSDYDSSHYRLGLELGRRWAINDCFAIRPFTSYEYLRLKVDGYNEGLGAYAAKLDGFTQSPQKLKTGVGLNWTDSERFFLEGRVYYAGLLSGREAETDLSFTQNDQVVYKIKGDELGRDALGLNLAATFNRNNTASLKLDGVMERGDNTTDRQGRLTLNIVW